MKNTKEKTRLHHKSQGYNYPGGSATKEEHLKIGRKKEKKKVNRK